MPTTSSPRSGLLASRAYVGDPQAAAAVASHWLDTATTAADQLHRALDSAQQATAHLAANDDG